MIIATPLDLPCIKPDTWEKFYDIWNFHAKKLIKVTNKNNLNSYSEIGDDSKWRGLDVYKSHNMSTVWQAPFFCIKNDLPLLYQQIISLPIKRLFRVRIIESQCNISSHSDDFRDYWAIRAFFRIDNSKPQWYFTEPGSVKSKMYLKMPNTTNWFAYNDKYCWHGSDYNAEHPKLLVQLFYFENVNDLVENSIDKYREYTISLNHG